MNPSLIARVVVMLVNNILSVARNADRLHQFLLGLLPKPYGSLRTIILAQSPLPTISRAFLLISQEERVRGIDQTNEAPAEIASFAVRTTPRPLPPPSSTLTRTERQTLVCSNCNRKGHDRSMCFDLLDKLLDWWYELKGINKPNRGVGARGGAFGSSANGGRGGPVRGGGRGSSARRDGTPSQKPESSNAVNTSAATTDGESSDVPITVYGVSTHTFSGKWLLDTGCSHHVTGDFSALLDVCTIPSRDIGLPDGSRDLLTRTVIGLGDRHDGLYYLRKEPTIVTSAVFWIYLLNNKTDVYAKFMQFIAMILRQFSAVLKTVHSDNGTEFNLLKPYFNDNGILFQSSCVGTPQQNGHVERKHQHLLNVARALRFQAGLPIRFWGESAMAAAFIINRTPSVLLGGTTPYEVLFHSPPNFNILRNFGSLCYAHNQRAKGDKFASRSRKCVFMGYPSGKKGWYLFDLDTEEFFVSRDVVFYEDNFPFLTAAPPPKSNPTTAATDDAYIDWDYTTPHTPSARPTPNDQPHATSCGIPSADTGPSPSTSAGSTEPTVEPVILGRGHRT
ncbi:uncharacterized protein LOC141608805 [Silene latifolia]|uniref:uncharacterized protein LOC141608805 n=1 Tax=Silene latifolia TaxID=37657 RepID=UPI003D7812A8